MSDNILIFNRPISSFVSIPSIYDISISSLSTSQAASDIGIVQRHSFKPHYFDADNFDLNYDRAPPSYMEYRWLYDSYIVDRVDITRQVRNKQITFNPLANKPTHPSIQQSINPINPHYFPPCPKEQSIQTPENKSAHSAREENDGDTNNSSN